MYTVAGICNVHRVAGICNAYRVAGICNVHSENKYSLSGVTYEWETKIAARLGPATG